MNAESLKANTVAGKTKKSATKPKSSNKGPAVFLIVDDEGQRKQMANGLTNAGFTVHTYFTAREFLFDAVDKTGGVVIAGFRLREMSGAELFAQLEADGTGLPIVLLSGHADVPKVIKAGISEFLVHPFDLESLQDAIDRAMNCEEFTDKELSGFKQLTARELEVMNAVCNGQSSRDVAAMLGISAKTVEAHRARIMDKTRANDVGDLVRMRNAWKG